VIDAQPTNGVIAARLSDTSARPCSGRELERVSDRVSADIAGPLTLAGEAPDRTEPRRVREDPARIQPSNVAAGPRAAPHLLADHVRVIAACVVARESTGDCPTFKAAAHPFPHPRVVAEGANREPAIPNRHQPAREMPAPGLSVLEKALRLPTRDLDARARPTLLRRDVAFRWELRHKRPRRTSGSEYGSRCRTR
jgi:hypothetical protein